VLAFFIAVILRDFSLNGNDKFGCGEVEVENRKGKRGDLSIYSAEVGSAILIILHPRPEDPAPIYRPNSCGAGGAKYYHWQGQWSGGKKKAFLSFAPHGTGPWAKQKKKCFIDQGKFGNISLFMRSWE